MHTTVLTEETKIFCSEEFCYFSMAILRWGYFFAIWMVNILAFKSLKATVFTKASLGTIHIWRHHPLGGRKNCWRIDIKKCWHTGESGQRKGKNCDVIYGQSLTNCFVIAKLLWPILLFHKILRHHQVIFELILVC